MAWKHNYTNLCIFANRGTSELLTRGPGALHTPSLYHCHSTHICIWIWPSGGTHGYFSNKQAEVSTGEKTCDTTVYKVWKHVAWSKHLKFGRSRIQKVCWGSEIAKEFGGSGQANASCVDWPRLGQLSGLNGPLWGFLWGFLKSRH